MSIDKSVTYQKVCLNCKGDWDLCKGIECQCLDGSCCCEFSVEDMSQRSFWYEIVKKDNL